MQASNPTRGTPWHVLWWWLLASWVAWTSVYTAVAVLPQVEAPWTRTATYAGLGLLAATPQHWLLARWCRAPVWYVALCASAWALALHLSDRHGFMGIPAAEWLAFLGAPVAAGVQYTALRGHATRALWWIPVSTVAMAAAAWVGLTVGMEAYDRWYSHQGLLDVVAGGSAGGATFGLLSGLGLATLMRARPQ